MIAPEPSPPRPVAESNAWSRSSSGPGGASSRVLWNDPATGVMRHADAGYDIAIDCARNQGLDLPMIG